MPEKERSKQEKLLKNSVPILYEDEYFLIIDKPYGVVVNNASTTQEDTTIQDWIKNYHFEKIPAKEEKSGFDLTEDPEFDTEPDEKAAGDFYDRYGIVHRLDKDTSGVLVIAKTPESFGYMQDQFKSRKVKKEYTAMVMGRVKEFDNIKEIIVNAPISRNPYSRDKFAVVESGRDAETGFKLIRFLKYGESEFTLVKCFPKTGRTHQIRVHLTAIGHPVVGDKLYSGRNRLKSVKEIVPRQMLHANRIEFKHPGTKTMFIIESSLPAEFLNL